LNSLSESTSVTFKSMRCVSGNASRFELRVIDASKPRILSTRLMRRVTNVISRQPCCSTLSAGLA